MSVTPAYPLPRPANGDDARFSLGLTLDVAAVLARHGYPALSAGEDLIRLRQALFGLIYQQPAPTSSSMTPPRDDPATMSCPVCQTSFTPTGRQRYCSTPCRKTAFRRRHQDPPTTVVVPASRPRRQITVYECPTCGERLLGEQRCQPCGAFTGRIGIGGPCPHCDEPISLADLLDQEITISHSGSTPSDRRGTATQGNPADRGNRSSEIGGTTTSLTAPLDKRPSIGNQILSPLYGDTLASRSAAPVRT